MRIFLSRGLLALKAGGSLLSGQEHLPWSLGVLDLSPRQVNFSELQFLPL